MKEIEGGTGSMMLMVTGRARMAGGKDEGGDAILLAMMTAF